MKVVFASNYLNHHQLPLAESFLNISGIDYYFIATTPFNNQRADMGYSDINGRYDFVIRSYEDEKQEEKAHLLFSCADLAIIGSAPDCYMSERLKEGKVTFHTSERYFKKGLSVNTLPRYFASAMKHIWPYQNKPLYYLCSSAYTAKDVNTFTDFKGRCFKWGYFTEVPVSSEEIIAEKRKANKVPVILWAGRFLSWKHPDAAIRVASKLKKLGYRFRLDIIGGGDLDEELKELSNQLNVDDVVRFLGFLPPEQVREHMEAADVYLFTSDFNEGWGAVLNEAMSSGCAVIASHACGASPYLIRDGVNGFLYEDGNETELFEKVKTVIDDRKRGLQLGIQAYKDMVTQWSPKVAAERLIQLNEAISHDSAETLYAEGPCSPAPILSNGWYRG